MGNIASCTLSDEEVSAFQSSTVFSANEIKSLWIHFRCIVGEEEEYISRDKFQAVMLFRDTAMLDRIFRVFDEDEDQRIARRNTDDSRFMSAAEQLHIRAESSRLLFRISTHDGLHAYFLRLHGLHDPLQGRRRARFLRGEW